MIEKKLNLFNIKNIININNSVWRRKKMEDKLNLEVKNFGPINKAKIELGDINFKKNKKGKINIIAGKNASGKSILSRLIYTSLASIGNDGEYTLNNYLNTSLLRIQRFLGDRFQTLTPSEIKQTHDTYKDKKFFNKLNDFYHKFKIFRFEPNNNKEYILEELLQIEKLFNENDYHPQTIEDEINKIKTKIEISKHPGKIRMEKFHLILMEEFGEDIIKLISSDNDCVNFYLHEKESLIQMGFEETTYSNQEKIKIGDVYYIETPYILDFHKNQGFPSWYTGKFPLHHQNALINKLKSDEDYDWSFGSWNADKVNNPKKLLNKIVDGNIKYKANDDVFKFTPNKGKEFNITNTAAGIKIIGILQLLLNKGLDDNSFIIMDEPEIHLHPDWQIILAEAIIILARECQINFHINTHSPQFVEAIDVYSRLYKMKTNTSFYLFEQIGNLDKYNLREIKQKHLVEIYDNLGKAYDKLDEIKGELFAKDIQESRN